MFKIVSYNEKVMKIMQKSLFDLGYSFRFNDGSKIPRYLDSPFLIIKKDKTLYVSNHSPFNGAYQTISCEDAILGNFNLYIDMSNYLDCEKTQEVLQNYLFDIGYSWPSIKGCLNTSFRKINSSFPFLKINTRRKKLYHSKNIDNKKCIKIESLLAYLKG